MSKHEAVAAEETLVARLRLSQVATRIHDHLAHVGLPGEFQEILAARRPVSGIEVTLPYSDDTPVDTAFWSTIAENRSLSQTVNEALAKILRRHGVPLRHRAAVEIDNPPGGASAGPSYAEVHLHPFGAVGVTTIDIVWRDALPLAEVWSLVDEMQSTAARITVANAEIATTVGEGSAAVARRVVEVVAEPGGREWIVPSDYRIVSVIDGSVRPLPAAMPPPSSAMHGALHYLCGGTDPLASPGDAFVPLWSGANFDWSPTQLVYMLDRGAAVWSLPTPRPSETAGGRHRRLVLLLAHVTATVGLVIASQESANVLFSEWARIAAQRLARLYGPSSTLTVLGLETRRYVNNTQVRQVIEQVLQAQLDEKMVLPPYP